MCLLLRARCVAVRACLLWRGLSAHVNQRSYAFTAEPAVPFHAPQKFILTALLLAPACGVSGAAAARTPSHTYMQVLCLLRLLYTLSLP